MELGIGWFAFVRADRGNRSSRWGGKHLLLPRRIDVGGSGPDSYSIGRRASAVGMLRAAMLTMVVLVSIAAVVAVLETRRRSYFVADPTFFVTPDRDGQFRARGFFPQSLVLALCCSAAVFIAVRSDVVRSRYIRAGLVAILGAGIWASASRAALFVALAVGATYLGLRALQRARAGRLLFGLLGFATIAIAVIFLGGFLTQGGSLVTSQDPDVASAQFRAELYRNSQGIVAERWGGDRGWCRASGQSAVRVEFRNSRCCAYG